MRFIFVLPIFLLGCFTIDGNSTYEIMRVKQDEIVDAKTKKVFFAAYEHESSVKSSTSGVSVANVNQEFIPITSVSTTNQSFTSTKVPSIVLEHVQGANVFYSTSDISFENPDLLIKGKGDIYDHSNPVWTYPVNVFGFILSLASLGLIPSMAIDYGYTVELSLLDKDHRVIRKYRGTSWRRDVGNLYYHIEEEKSDAIRARMEPKALQQAIEAIKKDMQ